MSINFDLYRPSLKAVYTALQNTPIKLDQADFSNLCNMTDQIIAQEEKRLGDIGWTNDEINGVKDRAVAFWEKYHKRVGGGKDFFEYSLKEGVENFEKIWSFNQFFGTFEQILQDQPSKDKNVIQILQKMHLDKPYFKLFSILNLYLGFYENFQAYLSNFFKQIFVLEFKARDGNTVKNASAFRLLLRQNFNIDKFDTVFDYQMRNWIAHHNFVMDGNTITFPNSQRNYNFNKGIQRLDVDKARKKLVNLVSVIIIIMTLFDKHLFEMMKLPTVIGDSEVLQYFKAFFESYFKSWEKFGKI